MREIKMNMEEDERRLKIRLSDTNDEKNKFKGEIEHLAKK